MFNFFSKNSSHTLPILILLIAGGIGGFYFYQQNKIIDTISVEDARRVEEFSKKAEFSKKDEVKSAVMPREKEANNSPDTFIGNNLFPPPPVLRVVAPNGGESLCRGQNFIIRWESAGLKTVSVFLKNAKDVYPPATDNPFAPRPVNLGTFPASYNERGTEDGSGEFSWKVGYFQSGPFENQVEIGSTYEILITGMEEGRTLEDTSDNVFSINFCEG